MAGLLAILVRSSQHTQSAGTKQDVAPFEILCSAFSWWTVMGLDPQDEVSLEMWFNGRACGNTSPREGVLTLPSPHVCKPSPSSTCREAALFWRWKFDLFLLKKRIGPSFFSLRVSWSSREWWGGWGLRGSSLKGSSLWWSPVKGPCPFWFLAAVLSGFPCSSVGTVGRGCVSGDPGRAPVPCVLCGRAQGTGGHGEEQKRLLCSSFTPQTSPNLSTTGGLLRAHIYGKSVSRGLE